MKKVFFFLAFLLFSAIGANAQVKTETGDSKMKVKPILTPKDRVHNVIHHRHKQAHGYTYKQKNADGQKTRVKAKTSTPVPKKDD